MSKLLAATTILASLALPATAVASTAKSTMLYPNGLADVRFGQPTKQVEAKLVIALGDPAYPGLVASPPNCTVDSSLRWPTLTVYFFRGRFVGCGYTTRRDMGFGTPALRRLPQAETTKGLEIGATLVHARKIYPTRFTTSFAQSGTWLVSTPTGIFRGYLTSEPDGKTPLARIATIGAGSVGCPAVSP